MENHEKYMKTAIELAACGTGCVNPNPLVGAVIVKNERIIGKGFHARCGELHAERNAFAHCTESAEGADMYVTLEPCCHYGRTPPCTEAIIEHKIKRVFVGSDDPNPAVSGNGIKKLRDNGIEVITGVLKHECDSLNEIFFHYISTSMPYVILKYAMTADGKISTFSGKSKWITCEESRKNVHKTRNKVAAIMTGVGTVIADDPMLTCRIENPNNPVRIICDSTLKIPPDSNVLATAHDIPTYIATVSNDDEKTSVINQTGAGIIKTKPENNRVDLRELMTKLGQMKIDSVLVEGGSELAYSALEANIVKKLQVYIAPKIFGGSCAKTAVSGTGVNLPSEAFMLSTPEIKRFGDDILLEYNIK